MDTHTILSMLTQYTYLLLFPAVLIEGPVASVVAGFLVSMGILDFYFTYILIILGDVCGDTFYYALGKWSGVKIWRWIGRYVGLKRDTLTKLVVHYDKHAMKTIILGKFAYGMETPFLIGAGMAGVPYRNFFFYTLFATFPKSLLFLLIGYHFAQSYTKITTYLDYTAILSGLVVLGLLGGYIFLTWIGRRYRDSI